jgi:hypothetical protein
MFLIFHVLLNSWNILAENNGLSAILDEIDHFVIKSNIFRGLSILKIFLIKLSCYHDNYIKYFMFEKYNGFVSKARVSACMHVYFLVSLQ